VVGSSGLVIGVAGLGVVYCYLFESYHENNFVNEVSSLRKLCTVNCSGAGDKFCQGS
jgi:hypothetical protein